MDQTTELKEWLLHNKVQMNMLNRVFEKIIEKGGTEVIGYNNTLKLTYSDFPPQYSRYYTRPFVNTLIQLGLVRTEADKWAGGTRYFIYLNIDKFAAMFLDDYIDLKERLSRLQNKIREYTASKPSGSSSKK
jgi:hypothetical protein